MNTLDQRLHVPHMACEITKLGLRALLEHCADLRERRGEVCEGAEVSPCELQDAATAGLGSKKIAPNGAFLPQHTSSVTSDLQFTLKLCKSDEVGCSRSPDFLMGQPWPKCFPVTSLALLQTESRHSPAHLVSLSETPKPESCPSQVAIHGSTIPACRTIRS